MKPAFRVTAVAVAAAASLAATLTLTAGRPADSNTAVPVAAAAQTSDRPNVLLILTDDQRAGMEAAMPNVMDRIAGEGVTYPNAFVPTSWCCPSRASLLSGKFAHNDGVWENASNHDYGAWPAFHNGGEENDTIATRLNNVGYNTGLFGKYLNDLRNSKGGYTPPGWDTFEAFLGGGYSDYRLSSDGPDTRREGRKYLTDALSDKAINFMRQSAEDNEPFFVYYSPFAPHYPYDPGPYAGKTRQAGLLDDLYTATDWPNDAVQEADMRDKPRWMRKLPNTPDWVEHNPNRQQDWTVEEVIENQADTLWGVDRAVGEMLDMLEQTGQLDNTVVLFMSDNGYSWNEHRLQGKNTPYDSSIRVPYLIRQDGVLESGTVDDRLVAANIDAHATILNLAGVKPGNIDGISTVGTRQRDGVLLEATRWRGFRNRPAYCGWRTADNLYVRYSTGEEELYDYTTDPHELTNQAGNSQYGDVLTRMRQATRNSCDPTPPGFTWNPNEKTTLTRPTNVQAIQDGKTVRVTWRAPKEIGRLNVTYVVQEAGKKNTTVCTVQARTSGSGLRCLVKKPKADIYTVTAIAGKQRAQSTAARVRGTR